MSLTFYYAPMSTASVTDAVLRELERCGVCEVERFRLSLQAGDAGAPGFLALNPNGQVPVIVHDGVPIWESAAITLYLGETFGAAAGLYPAPGPTRGEAMKWTVWGSGALAAAAGDLARAQDAARDEAVAHAALTAKIAILDGALAGRAYLAGDYSLADAHVFMVMDWIELMQLDLAEFPNVKAWMARCRERPALTGGA